MVSLFGGDSDIKEALKDPAIVGKIQTLSKVPQFAGIVTAAMNDKKLMRQLIELAQKKEEPEKRGFMGKIARVLGLTGMQALGSAVMVGAATGAITYGAAHAGEATNNNFLKSLGGIGETPSDKTVAEFNARGGEQLPLPEHNKVDVAVNRSLISAGFVALMTLVTGGVNMVQHLDAETEGLKKMWLVMNNKARFPVAGTGVKGLEDRGSDDRQVVGNLTPQTFPGAEQMAHGVGHGIIG